MIVAHRERPRYQLTWPRWQPPGRDGLAALVAATTSTAWADGLLARDGGQLVVWAATPADPEDRALSRLHVPGVRAVTLVPARCDPRWVRLALEYADHLATARADSEAHGACLTSCTRPAVRPGAVRIPHLVTIERDGTVTDTVLWELTPHARAQRWLDGPLPDQRFFEAHLDHLLRLRSAARSGRLPPRAVAAGLTELLADRELSIRIVYRHAAQFARILTGEAHGRSGSFGIPGHLSGYRS